MKTERNVELLIGKLLRYGVIVSCIISVAGGIIYLFQHQGTIPDYAPVAGNSDMFRGAPEYLRGISAIFPRVLALDGAAIIQLGVIVLVATPIFRVVFSLFAFLYEKDYLYVVITLIVLLIILANMLFGLH
ncbi:MAG: DUF1634 domain-containing protein [Prevotellaceae bacterium]|jgi:uncharacterized membrane protein|nr:DUF1634 domain-containing protein [Prevotellaceae bacterium]